MLPSILRTIVPLIAGVLIAQAARVGLDLPSGAVTEILTVVATAGYYALARAIEQYFPTAGKWLLALGLTSRRPVYLKSGR